MDTVSIVKCNEYNLEKLENAIKATFDNLGGISLFIKPGMKVLLKLNLLMKKRPDEAVTTNPIFAEALVLILQKAGAIVTIADSPGGPYTESMLRGIYKVCGIDEVAKRTGAILNYDTGFRKVSFPAGKIIKSFEVINPVLENDLIITVPKLKTHGMTLFTGAVKNLFGVIPGIKKVEYHFRLKDKRDFCQMLVDLCEFVKPAIAIMDGIIGMEGDGPSGGNPREVGVIIGSANPYLVDMAATEIVGIKASEVYTIDNSVKNGLCPNDLSKVLIVGEDISTLRIKDFKLPAGKVIEFSENIPKFLRILADKAMSPKPVFIFDKCIGCGDCALNCPPKAINMNNKKPYVNLNKCIRCFCCQELCPKKAVEVKRSWLVKLLSK